MIILDAYYVCYNKVAKRLRRRLGICTHCAPKAVEVIAISR